MVSSAIASRALTPSGRRRFTLATKMLLHGRMLSNRGRRSHPDRGLYKRKTPRRMARVCQFW